MNPLPKEESNMPGQDSLDGLIIGSLAKLDRLALGISLGTLFGLLIFIATNVLILKGGDTIGPKLALLGQYFAGYDVTFYGSLVGLTYGLIVGFILGWLIAALRNFIVSVYVHLLKVRGNMSAVSDYIDNP